MLKTLAFKHGLLVGPSSGAVAFGASEYAKQLGPNDLVVMIFGDSGSSIFDQKFLLTQKNF